MNNMSGKKITFLLSLFVVGILIGCQKTEKSSNDNDKANQELVEYERKQTEEELKALALEMESYNTDIQNDSLTKLLDAQKEKIRLLIEELQTEKTTNARRILELREELATVRKVLISYIRQVDSLNQINKGLVAENFEVKQKYSKATKDIDSLSREKQALTETVSKAAMLEADNFTVETLDKKGKTTGRLSRMKNIAVTFTIAKNVTAPVGHKTIYARITNPNNEVMTKSPGNLFPYEGRNIQYSVKKEIEYKGERIKDTFYWAIEETLLTGNYRVELFADGNLIGTTTFTLK